MGFKISPASYRIGMWIKCYLPTLAKCLVCVSKSASVARELCARLQGPALLRPRGLWPARLLCPWDSPGKNPGMGCHFPCKGIFPTQGMNLSLSHLPASASRFLTTVPPGKPLDCFKYMFLFVYHPGSGYTPRPAA